MVADTLFPQNKRLVFFLALERPRGTCVVCRVGQAKLERRYRPVVHFKAAGDTPDNFPAQPVAPRNRDGQEGDEIDEGREVAGEHNLPSVLDPVISHRGNPSDKGSEVVSC